MLKYALSEWSNNQAYTSTQTGQGTESPQPSMTNVLINLMLTYTSIENDAQLT